MSRCSASDTRPTRARTSASSMSASTRPSVSPTSRNNLTAIPKYWIASRSAPDVRSMRAAWLAASAASRPLFAKRYPRKMVSQSDRTGVDGPEHLSGSSVQREPFDGLKIGVDDIAK